MQSKHSTHLTGFALAVFLSAILFIVVVTEAIPRTPTLALIAGTALMQILVHLYFFLGIRLRSSERIISLVFAFVLLVIMIGGTLWVMANLRGRMTY